MIQKDSTKLAQLRLEYDIMPINCAEAGGSLYLVTCIDAGSRTIIGYRVVPSNIDGSPPDVTARDVVQMMGGA
jgi:hypothetical protein